jgi:hypothetical protein
LGGAAVADGGSTGLVGVAGGGNTGFGGGDTGLGGVAGLGSWAASQDLAAVVGGRCGGRRPVRWSVAGAVDRRLGGVGSSGGSPSGRESLGEGKRGK